MKISVRDKELKKKVGDYASVCRCIIFYINIYTHTYLVCLHEFVHRFINRQSRDIPVSLSGHTEAFLALHSIDII